MRELLGHACGAASNGLLVTDNNAEWQISPEANTVSGGEPPKQGM